MIVQWHKIPYPLWRREMPGWLRPLANAGLRRVTPMAADTRPPITPDTAAHYLARWGLLDGLGLDENEARERLANSQIAAALTREDDVPAPAPDGPLRLPAQWEPIEAVIVRWPVLYPEMWGLHAQMVEAISMAADAQVMIPDEAWARIIALYLAQRKQAVMERVRFVVLPTDDVWVRDYGPIVGLDVRGEQVAVNAVYDPLPHYPQARDNAMPLRWATYGEIPLRMLDLHTEGGNLWSDGAGTLLMSEDIFRRNPGLDRHTLKRMLHQTFAYEKLIITPRLRLEETGHIDLLVKLASADTVLITAAGNGLNGERLRKVHDLFGQETNAQGQKYRIFALPAPPFYLNWGIYPVWRSYTNALTVNGRVLVPVFGLAEDARALEVYQAAMPDHEIVPIDCRASVNGGGAVHCLTKEIPAARSSASMQ